MDEAYRSVWKDRSHWKNKAEASIEEKIELVALFLEMQTTTRPGLEMMLVESLEDKDLGALCGTAEKEIQTQHLVLQVERTRDHWQGLMDAATQRAVKAEQQLLTCFETVGDVGVVKVQEERDAVLERAAAAEEQMHVWSQKAAYLEFNWLHWRSQMGKKMEKMQSHLDHAQQEQNLALQRAEMA